ncbi:A/G-specific adenine glycosylase [Pelagibaculum spongiae]|uniref:Adenine DNA glycosylase n=1 Tax=Pelagibaculum spongiae TaxID=2080658 RepID=A0A2V1GWJ1_9GAMM|nr:A/G-specific adenine glycosylase [Pelagibaculum spongiae]PVZ63519.1 A/G-specific adenine glycosylase [Pelagibaculum spongiae]
MSVPAPLFADQVLSWYQQHGRKDLPWHEPRTGYHVWLSEIMLQQTQVATVIPYFEKFIARFPTLADLANSDIDQVLALWSGLGYYARARNLHKCAQQVASQYQGALPDIAELLEQLPGIGRSTANAIVSQAFNRPAAILDGNVKRVLARYFAVEGWTGSAKVQKVLWQHAEQLTPSHCAADYTQAMMDLGAMVCTRSKPKCTECPIAESCQAKAEDLQSQLPTPKPKKAKPAKSCHMLILVNPQGKILLEKRPPSGIWGGLMCLPQIDNQQSLAEFTKQLQLQCSSEPLAWQPMLHKFTHFDLTITPVQIEVKANANFVAEDHWYWLAADKVLQAGLPTPVRKLIEALQSPIFQ